MVGIKAPKDFWLGLLYAGIGGFGLVGGRSYTMGTGGNMGPGYFPFYISLLLVILGGIAIARSLIVTGAPIGRVAMKPLALVTAAIIVFAVLAERAGLLVALPLTVLLAASASDRFRLAPLPLIGLVGFVAAAAGVFVYGLGLPLPLVGSWFQ